MKFSKFLLTLSSVTLISLLYVYQQTEILRLAYIGEKKTGSFEELLDKNSILRYNIGRSASLVHIGKNIYTNADYEMPADFKLVRIYPARKGMLAQAQRKENLLSRLFGIKTQAEAKTINP
ncbi:MAG: hypothetical protein WC658_02260 [Candidatus Omnitrophota bacterium]